MNSDEFIDIFSEIIQSDMEMTLDTPLADIEEWDSMALMALVAHFDARYGKPLEFSLLEGLKTVGDLARLAPDFKE